MVDDRRDGYYEKLLLVRYGGRDGIFSMLSGYLYQSRITSESHPFLSMLFEGMALSKLRHIRMLERLIYSFGDNESICFGVNQNGVFFSEENDLDVYEILKRDIELEQQSIKENMRLIEIINEPVAEAVLKNIIIDEKKHLKTINRIVSRLEL